MVSQDLSDILNIIICPKCKNKITLGLDNNKGAFVTMVVEDGPAENAGIKEKDVIVSLNSKPIESSNQLRNDVSSMRPGETAVFSIIRNELLQSVSAILGKRPGETSISDSYQKQKKYDLLGLVIDKNKNGEGVIIIDIDIEGEAYKNNLRKNDIINEINRTEIKTLENYNKEIKNYKSGDVVMVRIIRSGQNIYEAFEIK